MFRAVCLTIVSLTFSSLAFAENAEFSKTKIVVQEGEKTKEYDARVLFTDSKELVIEDKKKKAKPWAVTIPFDQIEELTYERSTHPRAKTAIFLSPFALFSKSKKHWLTVTYKKSDATDFVILRLDKKEYQRMLVTAETKTGIEVERITEE